MHIVQMKNGSREIVSTVDEVFDFVNSRRRNVDYVSFKLHNGERVRVSNFAGISVVGVDNVDV